MSNRTILVGLAATFVGLTALLVVAGIVVNPLLLAVAIPFGAVAYLLWYHASGRLQDRVRREAAGADAAERVRARQRARATAHRRRGEHRTRFSGQHHAATEQTTADGHRGGFAGGAAGNRSTGSTSAHANGSGSHGAGSSRPSKRAAYARLGLDPGANDEAIRSAYRDRAKRLHPDRDNGDEDGFKAITEAYEVLLE